MRQYPYLAQYKNTTQLDGIVLLMLEPHHGIAVYIPPGVPENDLRFEAHLGETYSPANNEVQDYTGSVVLRGNQDPTLAS